MDRRLLLRTLSAAGLAAVASAQTEKVDTRKVLVCFGDSLTAGYGVGRANAYPALLQKAFDERHLPWRVINAGQSGDTTSGGLNRLSQVLRQKPAVVLLELGANDGLNGFPTAITRMNLEQIISTLKSAGAQVALAGMTLPRNYGGDFIQRFEGLYDELAKQYKLRLIRFELEPLAKRGLLQADGMHPTAEGYQAALPSILAGLLPVMKIAGKNN